MWPLCYTTIDHVARAIIDEPTSVNVSVHWEHCTVGTNKVTDGVGEWGNGDGCPWILEAVYRRRALKHRHLICFQRIAVTPQCGLWMVAPQVFLEYDWLLRVAVLVPPSSERIECAYETYGSVASFGNHTPTVAQALPCVCRLRPCRTHSTHRHYQWGRRDARMVGQSGATER
jgi:hypothetical protein